MKGKGSKLNPKNYILQKWQTQTHQLMEERERSLDSVGHAEIVLFSFCKTHRVHGPFSSFVTHPSARFQFYSCSYANNPVFAFSVYQTEGLYSMPATYAHTHTRSPLISIWQKTNFHCFATLFFQTEVRLRKESRMINQFECCFKFNPAIVLMKAFYLNKFKHLILHIYICWLAQRVPTFVYCIILNKSPGRMVGMIFIWYHDDDDPTTIRISIYSPYIQLQQHTHSSMPSIHLFYNITLLGHAKTYKMQKYEHISILFTCFI